MEEVQGPSDLYAVCVSYGFETDHHASDLYIKRTPLAEAVVRSWCAEHTYARYTFFTDSSDREWIEVPFHYTPFWPKA